MWLEAQHVPGLGGPGVMEFLLHGKGCPAVESMIASHRKMLALGNKWLNVFLPHVLQKVDRYVYVCIYTAARCISNQPFKYSVPMHANVFMYVRMYERMNNGQQGQLRHHDRGG